MARIGIITCSNCTQESNCASVVCLGDLRKRRGFFEKYPKEEPLDLIGIINCAGCPTVAAPEKIMKKVQALAEFKIDALHLSFCLTALCPFINKYVKIIKKSLPQIKIIRGTHKPVEKTDFQKGVKELLCQTLTSPQTMTDMIKGTLKIPQE
ncbi:MAG: CGGC domain-containing protein [Deltaproteobacteria bacterium RBG_13_58_19]|nr:MAG: CGGC domain-containing protein [Deltaproteobacteria bacterium RBG_13_58_19]